MAKQESIFTVQEQKSLRPATHVMIEQTKPDEFTGVREPLGTVSIAFQKRHGIGSVKTLEFSLN